MRKALALFTAIVLMLCAFSTAPAEEIPVREILAVYCSSDSQFIPDEDESEEPKNTVIYLYTNYTYTLYTMDNGRLEVYSEGDFTINFNWGAEWDFNAAHNMTLHTRKINLDGRGLTDTDLVYDLDLNTIVDYCLYPDNTAEDQELLAAYMQADKQLFVRTDGSQEYLPTVWFYYSDGTFEQFVVHNELDDVLFSTGDYKTSDSTFADGAVLTVHRTQKYQDGTGLAPYDSLHDYEPISMGFVRIYPDNGSAW